MSQPFPQTLLGSVLWSCGRKSWPSRDDFNQAVRQYHQDIVEDGDRWQPDAVVFPHPAIRVGFSYWADTESQGWHVLSMEADAAEGFTALGLLHGLCEGIAGHLTENNGDLYDHCFFEGLSLADEPGDPPMYYIRFGS